VADAVAMTHDPARNSTMAPDNVMSLAEFMFLKASQDPVRALSRTCSFLFGRTGSELTRPLATFRVIVPQRRSSNAGISPGHLIARLRGR